MILSWLNPHSIDTSVYDKANQYSLGVPSKKYQKPFLRLRLILLLFVLAGSIYMCIISLSLYQEGQSLMQQFSRSCTGCSEAEEAPILLKVHADLEDTQRNIWEDVCLTILALFALWAYWSQCEESLYRCDQGLLFLNGKLEEAVRWDKIREIEYENWRHLLFLRCNDGHTLCISQRLIRKALRDTIEQEVFAYLLPPLLEQYASGDVLRFGKLVISRQGVWLRGQKIGWDEIEDVGRHQKHIVVKIEGRRKRIRGMDICVYKTTHIRVCVELIKRIRDSQKTDGPSVVGVAGH